MKKYNLIINYGCGNKTYVGFRKNNTPYFDYNSSVGCSTINIKSKHLIDYYKF